MAEQGNEYEQYAPPAKDRLFTSAMFGFNKEEVLDYLEEMTEENYQRQEAAEHRIHELTNKIKNLEILAANRAEASAVNPKELEQGQQEIDQLRASLDIAQAATQQTADELQEYKEQLFNAQKENAWLREEYQKSDSLIADLRRQLDAASAGQWTEAEEQITELRNQLIETKSALQEAEEALQETEEALQETEEALQQAEIALEEAEQAAPAAVAPAPPVFTPSHTTGANQAASIIIAEANEEAERIRQDALAEKERIHRQILNSAGGLNESITNLRTDISNVEGEVTDVLESVQQSLAETLAALGRTEQHLDTLNIQAQRFPSSSPAVKKPQQQVVYFQPGNQLETNQPLRGASLRAQPQQSLGNSGFRRVWPSPDEGGSNTRPFQPTYTNSPPAHTSAEAYQIHPGSNPSQQQRIRNLAESLVESLIDMLQE